jgi:hypothetical protein
MLYLPSSTSTDSADSLSGLASLETAFDTAFFNPSEADSFDDENSILSVFFEADISEDLPRFPLDAEAVLYA